MTDFIERVRSLDKTATEGPWEVGEEEQWDLDGDRVPQKPVMARGRPLTWDDHGGEVFEPSDAEFIAAARTMLPDAVEALARVRELHRQFSLRRVATLPLAMPPEDIERTRWCAICEVAWPCATYQATEVQA